MIYSFIRGDLETANILKFTRLKIIPIVNPDGYEYVRQSFINNENIDRVEDFIKNRNTNGASCSIDLAGVNLRNNYPYKFGEDNLGSEPSNHCQ